MEKKMFLFCRRVREDGEAECSLILKKAVVKCFAFGLGAKQGSSTWLLHSKCQCQLAGGDCTVPKSLLYLSAHCQQVGWLLCSTVCVANDTEHGTLTREQGCSWTRSRLWQFGEECETTEGKASADALALWGYAPQALDSRSAEAVFRFLGFFFLLQ